MMPSNNTYACECSSLADSIAFQQADLVFVGEVVGAETNWMSGGWKFSFLVKESWKQQTGQAYVVNSEWEKDCGYIFEQGKEYLVFVNRKFTPKTNTCMGNRPLQEAAPFLALLGPGSSPRPSSTSSIIYLDHYWSCHFRLIIYGSRRFKRKIPERINWKFFLIWQKI